MVPRRASALLLLAWGCSHTELPARGPIITSLAIEGNDALSDGTIEEKIVTESTGWWPFATAKHFDPVTWQKDRKRIERLYASRGYYHAKVTATQVPPDTARDASATVELEVTVDEGPRATTLPLVIEGTDALDSEARKKLGKRLPLKEGKPFVEARWAETKEQLEERLRRLGHAQASVNGLALVHLDRNRVDARVWLRPGPVYHFGDIELEQLRGPITGSWIREQVRLAAPEGALVTPEALDEAQKRVFAMGVFSRAEVEAGAPDPKTGRLPLRVRTATAPFHHLRLGGGAGFDQVRNEVRLLASWSDANFRGGLRLLRLRALVGWAFLPDIFANVGGTADPAARNGPIARVNADFEQPRLFGAPAWKLALRAEAERQMQEAFTALSMRAGPEVIWQLRSDLRLTLGYTLDVTQLETLSEIPPLFAGTILGCPEGRDRCVLWLSYLTQRLTFDRRDNPLAPRRGMYLDFALQEAGGPLAGTYTYLRVLADVRGYVSFGPLTLAARAQAGSLLPASGDADDTPILQRLYAGGGMSMRGFGYRRLSPLAAVLPTNAERSPQALQTLSVGGNGLAVGNLESRLGVGSSTLLAAFYDVGAVTRDSWASNVFDSLFHAVGFGVRFLTPVGAIRLDLARRFPGAQRDVDLAATLPGGVPRFVENTSCFGFGGGSAGPGEVLLRDGLCQFHLSIGEAF